MKAQSDNPLPHAVQSSTPARFSPTAGRRAHDAAAVLALHDHTSTASLPPSPAPSSSRLDTLQTPSLSAALADRLPLAQPSTPHLCVANARACVRLEGGAWRAPQKTPSTTLAAAAPAALVAWPKTIDGPLSGQKHQNSSDGRRRAARARRAAPAVARPYRRLGPSEQPSRGPPIAPVVGLEPCCIAVL
jgi:hypothetical protein